MRGDLEWGTIPGLVRAAARDHAEREAIADGDVRLNFAELAESVEEAGRAFLAAGVQQGDRVAIWAPNIWEWVVALLGLHAAGAVLVPLNTRYKGGEAGYILRRSGARIILAIEGFLDTDYVSMLVEANGGPGQGRPVADLEDLERIVVLRGRTPTGTESWEGFLAGGAEVDAAELEGRIAGLGPDDLSDILFTSGTTGNPKGVMCTHGQTLRAFADWSEVVGLDRDRYLIVNPFFHGFGYKAGILACLMTGSTMLPVPVFDVPTVMEVAAREKATMLPGPPAIYQTILNHPDLASFDLSGLKRAVTGAAVIPVSLVEQMRTVLGFDVVVTGYGLTEACGIATMCRHDDDPETIATTSGRAVPGVEVWVVDDDGRELPRGEPGEVVVRGYNVMKGYFDEPEQTAEAIDADGWLHTGDIGVMDARGYLKITDRKKDMFIVGGFNAYPAEIESLLLGHPEIAQAAVVGVPDERLGEVGYAFVVPTAGTTPDPGALHESGARGDGELQGSPPLRGGGRAPAQPERQGAEVPAEGAGIRRGEVLTQRQMGRTGPGNVWAVGGKAGVETAETPGEDAVGDLTEEELRAADGHVPGRRGRATRQRLLECTLELLRSTSYRDVKVVDIAREAGTSPATFYQYFPDVEAAILVLAEDMARAGQELAGLVRGQTWKGKAGEATSRALVDGVLAFWEENRSVMRVVELATLEGDQRFRKIRTSMLNELTKALAEQVERSAGDGRGPARGEDPMATAGVLVAMLAHVAAHRWGFEFWGIRTGDLRLNMARIILGAVTGQTPAF